MKWWNRRVSDNDSLFRHSVFPVAFKSRRFAQEKLIKLYEHSDGSLLASLVWQRYAPTTQLIHDSGCRLARRRNDRKRAEGGFKEKDRQIYCGAYRLIAGTIRALAVTDGLSEVLSADVVHHIEDGEIAHTDLKIILKSNNGADVEGIKTAILDRLWNLCSGPLRHQCDYDSDISHHPSSELIPAPTGPYVDRRSRFLRFCCIIRFRFCCLLWRSLPSQE